jgi:superfamily II DNA or RNA helicase
MELQFKNINIYDKEGYFFKTILCNEYQQILEYYPVKKKLFDYQKLPANFFQPNSKFNSLLLYHGTGLGKTATAISILNNIYTFSNKINIIIICPASLKSTTWIPNLTNWINNKNLLNIINFISIDSPTFVTEFDTITKTISINMPTIILIDECHYFVSSLIDEDSNRKVVYNQLLNIRKNYKTFLICMTATPIVNKVEEIIYLFNLLRPDTFHNKESIFYDIFTNSLNGQLKNQHIFCKRITGLVSYFETFRKKEMPHVNNFIIRLQMSNNQEETYSYVESQELKKGGGYKQQSISMCNFAPPLNVMKNGGILNYKEIINNTEYNELENMSPKFIHILNVIKDSKRPNLIHTSFIKSTMIPLEYYLEKYGYIKYEKINNVSFKNYFSISGETSTSEREHILKIFNDKSNMYGEEIKILIVSDVFSTGVTIKYVENLFVMNYHWNSSKIKQIYGRIERLTTHVDLPIDERIVNKYIYVMTRKNGISADQSLEKITIQKDTINDMFLHLIKISSIDFEFNKYNSEFLYKDIEPFKISLHEIKDTLSNKKYIYPSIMDEENIFKNVINDLKINKINTRQLNVVYFNKKNDKKIITCLLIYPIFNYYLLDIKYYNYIGYIKTENNRPLFDKDTNYFIAEIIL